MGFQKPYALFPCFFVICERTSRSYGGGFNVQLWVSKNPTLSSLNSLLIVSALAAVTVEALNVQLWGFKNPTLSSLVSL